MSIFSSRPMNDDQLARSRAVRSKATDLLEVVEKSPPSRERSLAVTNLEQAVMWANKAISREEG